MYLRQNNDPLTYKKIFTRAIFIALMILIVYILDTA